MVVDFNAIFDRFFFVSTDTAVCVCVRDRERYILGKYGSVKNRPYQPMSYGQLSPSSYNIKYMRSCYVPEKMSWPEREKETFYFRKVFSILSFVVFTSIR